MAKIFSTSSDGTHFYSIVKSDYPKNGFYKYDDLLNGGYSVLQNSDSEVVGVSEFGFVIFYCKQKKTHQEEQLVKKVHSVS